MRALWCKRCAHFLFLSPSTALLQRIIIIIIISGVSHGADIKGSAGDVRECVRCGGEAPPLLPVESHSRSISPRVPLRSSHFPGLIDDNGRLRGFAASRLSNPFTLSEINPRTRCGLHLVQIIGLCIIAVWLCRHELSWVLLPQTNSMREYCSEGLNAILPVRTLYF